MLKKIKTQEQAAREKKRNQIIVGSLLMGILLLSSIGYSFFSKDKTNNFGEQIVEENGLEFTKTNGIWSTKINGLEFGFQFLPSEVSDVPVDISLSLADYTGKVVYFVNANAISSEIVPNLNSYVLRSQESCLEGESCSRKDLPVKNCDEKLIIYKESNDTKVSQDKGCVYLQGDAIKASDAFLYKILGVD